MNNDIENKISELYDGEVSKEMIEAGVFYGRKRTKTHPRMKPYIFRTYSNIEIINLNKTKEGLDKALYFLKEEMRKGVPVFLVGTQPAAEETVLSMAKEFDFPAVTKRWLGGTLTNFKVVSGRIEYYKKLKSQSEKGELDKYTKKERLKIGEEIGRLKELFGTMENYVSLPGVMVIVDPVVHKTAVREARRMKIPIVALASTDADPDSVDYLVVGNNKARASVNWFLNKVADALREAKNMPQLAAAEAAPADDETNQELAVE